jgi:nucleoside-diphosphate-sugar epimerase
MDRKILVTGGTGFIGSRVLTKLVDNGDIPIVLKRSFSDTWRIKEVENRIVVYDVDKIAIKDIFALEKIDAVINLATYYKKNNSYDDIKKMVETNITFPSQLLELCKIHEIPLFITTGSFFQYNKTNNILDENTSMVARDLYAATKNALEKIMEHYASNTDLKVIELILFTPYGEMDHEEKLVPYIVKQTLLGKPVNLTNGFQMLNLVYVEDIARAFVKALDLRQNGFPLRINIANKESYSVRDIITVVEDIIGHHIVVNWGALKTKDIDQDKVLYIDTVATGEILNWKSEFDIYRGLKKTIEYYKGVLHEN